MEVHSVAVKLGMIDNVLVGNSLVDLYSKCGDVKAAERVFDAVSEKDLYTWNSRIGGYFQVGCSGKAHERFTRMQESNVERDVITWNVMVSGYMRNGDDDQAINLFRRLEKEKIKRTPLLGIHLSPAMLIMAKRTRLWGCSGRCKVKELHGCVLRRNLEFVASISNSLIDAYAKAGKIEYSWVIYDSMRSRDVITWNSMLSGCVLHGHDRSAVELFRLMRNRGLRPRRGTFVSLLKAYGLAGMVDEGKRVFTSISEEHLILPALEHYLAMVELYGRAGRLWEALEFNENMPVEPDSSIWMAFFTACRFHKKVRLALAAAENLVNLEPSNRIFHDLIQRTSALCSGYEHASASKGAGNDSTIRKFVGQSWTIIDHEVHAFTNGKSDLHSKLHPWLKEIEAEARGFEPLPGLCVEEDGPEEHTGSHSEKLAMAFSLIGNNSAPLNNRIMKNSRMCTKCHGAAKCISLSHSCEIYISDARYIHRFKDGTCSCRDYW